MQCVPGDFPFVVSEQGTFYGAGSYAANEIIANVTARRVTNIYCDVSPMAVSMSMRCSVREQAGTSQTFLIPSYVPRTTHSINWYHICISQMHLTDIIPCSVIP